MSDDSADALPLDEALDWFVRLQAEDADDALRRACADWRAADPRNTRAWALARSMWDSPLFLEAVATAAPPERVEPAVTPPAPALSPRSAAPHRRMIGRRTIGGRAAAGGPAVGGPAAQGVRFDIPAQGLVTALNAFSRSNGWNVGASAETVRGLASPGVSGTMGAAEALRRLLSGTGVSFRMNGPDGAELFRVQSDGLLLPPVTVEGAGREHASGPLHGYVARRSATATKTNSSILETPQSVSVVGAEEMWTRNVQTVEDAIKYTPGVHLPMGGKGDSRTGWLSIRGFNANDIYIDGLTLRDTEWSRGDLYNVERTEILRGPASVLYGESKPGGMVNLVSKRPQDKAAAEFGVGYGSFDWKRLEGDVTGPLDAEGRFLYRIVAAAHDSDGVMGIDGDRNKRTLVAPSLTWRPQPGTSLTVLASYQKDENNGQQRRRIFRTSAGATNPDTSFGDPNFDRYDQEHNSLTALGEHQPG